MLVPLGRRSFRSLDWKSRTLGFSQANGLAAVPGLRKGRQLTAHFLDASRPLTARITKERPGWPVVQQATFAPILYVLSYKDLDEAIDAAKR